MGQQVARCPKCREETLRKRWGCDADAEIPVWVGTCEHCLGGGCAECGMRGERPRMRCPASLSGWEGTRVVERAVAFDAGILPGPGCFGDQMHSGMAAINLVRSEQGKIERAMMDSAEKKT